MTVNEGIIRVTILRWLELISWLQSRPGVESQDSFFPPPPLFPGCAVGFGCISPFSHWQYQWLSWQGNGWALFSPLNQLIGSLMQHDSCSLVPYPSPSTRSLARSLTPSLFSFLFFLPFQAFGRGQPYNFHSTWFGTLAAGKCSKKKLFHQILIQMSVFMFSEKSNKELGARRL